MLHLRPARLDDPDALLLDEEVQQYYVQLYGGEDDDPLEPEQFAPPRGAFLIGYEDGVPMATGGWSRLGPDAKVRRMYVRAAGRRRGYAAAVLDALEADAAAAGAERMVLTTGEPQVEAVRFYRARGYVDVPPFGFYADSPTAVHLGRPLVGAGR